MLSIPKAKIAPSVVFKDGIKVSLYNEDELILAIIKNLTKQNLLSSEKKDILIETYSLLIGNDYKRIKLFLERVQNIVI